MVFAMNDAAEQSRERPWRLAWRRRHGFRRLLIGSAVVLLLPAVAFQLGRRAETVAEAVANATPPPVRAVTADVERRILDAGEVFRGEVVVVVQPITAVGPGVVVDVLAFAGDVVSEGQPVVVLDDRPLLLLRGDLPLLWDIDPNSTGSWVLQVQESLARLGLYETDIDGKYGPLTQQALAEMYKTIGFPPPLVDKGNGTNAVPGLAVGVPVAQQASGTPVLFGEIVFVPDLPARVVRVLVERGDVVEAGQALFELATTDPVIVATVSVADVVRFKEGGLVVIRVSGADDMKGRVTAIAETRDGNTGRSEWMVTITPLAPISTDLDGIGLKIVVGADEATVDPRLVVPASAISFSLNGTAYVAKQIAVDEFTNIEVVVGLETGGFVVVEPVGAELVEGDKIRVGLASPGSVDP